MVRLRVRIRFSKQGDLRLIGHRDLMRCLERVFRRAQLALGFSQGFHPKPRMTFPSALAVGIEGLDEVMEVELADAGKGDCPRPTFGWCPPERPAGGHHACMVVAQMGTVPFSTAEELLRRWRRKPPRGLRSARWKCCPRAAGKSASRAPFTKPRFPRRSKPAWLSGSSVCSAPHLGRSSAPRARPGRLAPAGARSGVAGGRAGDAAPPRRPPERLRARRAGGPGLGRHRAARRPPPPHRRGGLPMTMRTRRYCRTRKSPHETGNADQRRAAGRMPHRDR